jgi:glycosyltransferase involved in cell wall biosynthesis
MQYGSPSESSAGPGGANTRSDIRARRASRRIVFVLPNFRYDHVRCVHKQAYVLSEAGYTVILVVGHTDRRDYFGMQVIEARAPSRGLLRPALNVLPLFFQARGLDGDLFVLSNPDTTILAMLLATLGRNVYYETQEDFSQRTLMRGQLPAWSRKPVARILTALEKLAARVCRRVIVTQAHQVQDFGPKALYQPNAPLTTGPVVAAATTPPVACSEDKLSLLYVGGISVERGLFAMLDLAAELDRHVDCELIIVGWFSPAGLLEEAARHEAWALVRLHDTVTHAESLAQIKHADIGLALLKPVADHPTSSITKLFEYMHFGLPFIASDFPSWRVTSELGEPGVYVDPGSSADILEGALRPPPIACTA